MVALGALLLSSAAFGQGSTHAGRSDNPHTTSLGSLSDVGLTSPQDGQVLGYSAGSWRNLDPPAQGALSGTRLLGSDTQPPPGYSLVGTLLATPSWSARDDLPTPRQALAAAALDGRIHVVGGSNGSPLAVHEEYDPATDSWTTRAPMPTARQFLAAAAWGGKVYAFGGTGGTSKNEAYDPTTDSWSTLAPLPTPRFNLAAAALGDRIYVLGGSGA